MFVRTNEIELHTRRGWWGLLESPTIEFTIKFGPDTLGPTGPRTLRRWLRGGYTDRPTGRYAKIWRTLMMLHGARYSAVAYSQCAEIEVYDPAIARAIKYGPKMKNIQAMMALQAAASNDQQNASSHWNLRVNHDSPPITVDSMPCEKQCSVEYYLYSWHRYRGSDGPGKMLLQQFANAFGPPLTADQLSAATAAINHNTVVKCRVTGMEGYGNAAVAMQRVTA